jgi:hypothetical protein
MGSQLFATFSDDKMPSLLFCFFCLSKWVMLLSCYFNIINFVDIDVGEERKYHASGTVIYSNYVDGFFRGTVLTSASLIRDKPGASTILTNLKVCVIVVLKLE